MTDVQEKLLELLTDIDDICKQENIKYYLCLETALGAVEKHAFHTSCCEAHVAMKTADVLKFMDAVQKANRADRIVDSMLTNKTYPDFTVRYGDPGTMLIQLPYKPAGAIPCIAVTIHMIRYRPRVQKKYFRRTMTFWKATLKSPAACSNLPKGIAVMGCRFIKAVYGQEKLGRFLFKKWCALFSSNKKAKKISICAGKFVFKPDMLKYADKVVLEGSKFPVFGYVDEYLNKTYHCSNFKKITPTYKKVSSTLLASSYVPYQTYLDKVQEMGLDFDVIRRNMKNYEKYKNIVAEDNKVIDKYYNLVYRTEKRFAMYEKYMPMKKLLVKLHEAGRYEELNELLKPYRSVLLSCYKKGLGLCFDKEIFDITMDILRSEGRYSYVRKLCEMVPQEHWEPMVVKDYKGNLVEITDISELLPETK